MPLLRRIFNRPLHLLARYSPGPLRPALHRLRGVKVGKGVFIGEEVYIENEYPERVEIGRGAQVGIRTVILAHMRGPGRVVIGAKAWIGPNCVIAASAGQTLTIGEGSVVGASSVVTTDIEPETFVRCQPPQAVARVGLPLAEADDFQSFLRRLAPVRRRKRRSED